MNLYNLMPSLSDIPGLLHRVIKQDKSANRAHIVDTYLRYYEILLEDIKND